MKFRTFIAFLAGTALAMTAQAQAPSVADCTNSGRTIISGAGFIQGTSGDDCIFGSDGADVILARGGNDWVVAGLGDDFVMGGAGNDTLYGQGGSDELLGQGGDDMIRGGWGDDIIIGGRGNDEIRGGRGGDFVRAGGGDDWVRGGRGNDTIFGGAGNDEIHANQGADIVFGNSGNDFIGGGRGADVLDGGRGDDTIKGRRGGDQISGGPGNDRIHGNQGNDTINGGGGNDTLRGGLHADTINGGSGMDTIFGGRGADDLNGGADNDTLTGGNGPDMISGGDGDDWLDGGNGNDNLSGDAGIDICLNGETVSDTCEHTSCGAPECDTEGVTDRYNVRNSNPAQHGIWLPGFFGGGTVIMTPTNAKLDRFENGNVRMHGTFVVTKGPAAHMGEEWEGDFTWEFKGRGNAGCGFGGPKLEHGQPKSLWSKWDYFDLVEGASALNKVGSDEHATFMQYPYAVPWKNPPFKYRMQLGQGAAGKNNAEYGFSTWIVITHVAADGSQISKTKGDINVHLDAEAVPECQSDPCL